MPDVLIRGMEMPTNVFDCPLNSFGICDLAQDETHCDCSQDSRPEWCPLVPLPEGHGRLIDADALIENHFSDKLADLQAELDKARKAEAQALKDLSKAQSDKAVPPDVLEKLKKEAEAAAEASYKADSEALDKAKKERARAEEELEKARREAEAAAKSLAATQRELALAAPELAVFRSRFERVQADLSELVQSVDTLPADKQAGARRGLAALLDGMKEQIGDGEDE